MRGRTTSQARALQTIDRLDTVPVPRHRCSGWSPGRPAILCFKDTHYGRTRVEQLADDRRCGSAHHEGQRRNGARRGAALVSRPGLPDGQTTQPIVQANRVARIGGGK